MHSTAMTVGWTVNCRALTDPLPGLVGDASAVINLLASGVADQLTESLPVRLRVVDVVGSELADGRIGLDDGVT